MVVFTLVGLLVPTVVIVRMLDGATQCSALTKYGHRPR